MSRPRPLIALAAGCAGAIAALYVLLLRTTGGQRLDQLALDRRALATRPARYAIHDLLTTISVGMLVVVLALLVGQAIVRRRWPLALLAGALIGGAALWTEVLKHALFRPSLYPGEPFGNTFPSGHTTVAFAVGVAATLLAPAHLRRVVAVGAVLYGAAVGIAVVAAGWHRPSDVAAAFLVVTGWSALVAAATGAFAPDALAEEPRRARPRSGPAARHLLAGALALGAAYLTALALALARDGDAFDWTLPGQRFVGACALLAVLAAAVMAMLLRTLRSALPAVR